MNSNFIISCDWGTSFFRIRLANTESLEVLAEVTTEKGIAELNTDYSAKSVQSGDTREIFFLRYLQQQINELSTRNKQSLSGIPVVISGMASSTIGIRELPYASLPFGMSGEDFVFEVIAPSAVCRHTIILLSGVADENDVMRGEETQLTGIYHLCPPQVDGELIYILPGTHSKHIYVHQGKIKKFNTYMTGELFGLLQKHGVLANAIKGIDSQAMNEKQINTFTDGLHASGNSSLLHSLFMLRTNWLLGKYSKELNYYYLSGLLIGEELKSLQISDQTLFLLAGDKLKDLYQLALESLGLIKLSTIVPAEFSKDAALAGHIKMYKKILLKSE